MSGGHLPGALGRIRQRVTNLGDIAVGDQRERIRREPLRRAQNFRLALGIDRAEEEEPVRDDGEASRGASVKALGTNSLHAPIDTLVLLPVALESGGTSVPED